MSAKVAKAGQRFELCTPTFLDAKHELRCEEGL